jgi:cell division septation protein DedD
MADTLHRDASLTDDGFHEIQLSGKQLVALFMGGTTIAVLIFLCGVQVGRNVKGGSLAAVDATETLAASTAATPPAASTPSEAAPSSGPPAAEPPAPPQDDELSYAKRLQASDPAAGDKVQAAAPAAAAPAPEKSAEHKAAEAKPAAPPPVPTPAPAAAMASPQGRSGQWIVQLSAIKDRAQAVTLARDLVAKGYPAFVLDPSPGAPPIYRVQVGGYADRDKADQAARRLEKEEHYKPYVRSR